MYSCGLCIGGLSDLGAVSVQETFERAKAWVKELQRQASPNIVIALAGNKADLAERRLVEYEVIHSCPMMDGNHCWWQVTYVLPN